MFGIACGDIMFDDLSLYPEYERAVAAMGVPFFQVTGNHDLDYASRTAEGATATFERHFGPAHYSFDVGAVHYVVLQDVLWYGDGYVGYLPRRAARVAGGRPGAGGEGPPRGGGAPHPPRQHPARPHRRPRGPPRHPRQQP
ncbi:MAG: hypothetical protein IPK12_24425 [Gemmatimonadetes bacterium]|nr:hypothetical protein [Gemmatimonadota bacterium]